VIVAVAAAILVVVTCIALTSTGAPGSTSTVRTTLGAHHAQIPVPGPCLQNMAQCVGAGSPVSSAATLGTSLLVVEGPVIVAAAVLRRVRRSHRSSGTLPLGALSLIIRPPRILPVFA
jgi:hypothetical protein